MSVTKTNSRLTLLVTDPACLENGATKLTRIRIIPLLTRVKQQALSILLPIGQISDQPELKKRRDNKFWSRSASQLLLQLRPIKLVWNKSASRQRHSELRQRHSELRQSDWKRSVWQKKLQIRPNAINSMQRKQND